MFWVGALGVGVVRGVKKHYNINYKLHKTIAWPRNGDQLNHQQISIPILFGALNKLKRNVRCNAIML